MILTSEDVRQLCQVLKAYVSEWGMENVVVSFSTDGQIGNPSALDPANSTPANQPGITVAVECGPTRIHYTAPYRS